MERYGLVKKKGRVRPQAIREEKGERRSGMQAAMRYSSVVERMKR